MAKVTYELNGKTLEFELDDERAQQYLALMDGERKAEQKEKWRQRKKLNSFEALEENGIEFADRLVNIEDDFLDTYTVNEILHQLTEGQQAIIKMRYFEGFTITEIAKKLGVDKSAVSKQMKRALDHMKKIIK